MKKNSYSELMKILIIIVIGSLLSLWLFQYMNEKNRNEKEQQFISYAKEQIYLIDKSIKTELALLKSVVGLFEASDSVSRKEFSLFVNKISEAGGIKSFQAFEWVPHVSLAERNKYQLLARKEGFVDFKIKERNKEQRLIEARQRQGYYPVYYVEPYKGNELALGFDIASNPMRKKALEKSRDSGKMVASGKVNLIQLKHDRTGILIFHPIYDKNKPSGSVEHRRQSLLGFALGVMKVKSLVSSISTHHNMDSLDIDYYIFDQDESEQDALYINYAKEEKHQTPKLNLKDLQSGIHFEREIIVGDRHWNIIARPHNDDFNSKFSSQSVMLLLFSILVVVLLSAYIYVLSKRARSIEERDFAEQASVLSEARLNEAQRMAKVGSWELDLLSGELIWSDEIFRMFEIDKSKFGASYEAFLNAIHADDRDRVNQAYTDSLASRKPYEIVHRLRMNDGKIKYVREICESFYDGNQPIRSVGTVQDISQLYKTEQDLKTAMALNERVIDASPIGISIYDETGQCIAANQSIADIVGATHEQVLAQNYHKIKSWKESGLYEQATRAIENGERLRGEFEVSTTFGKHAIYDCMFVPFNQHGKQHLLLMIDDITDRKQAEEALRDSEEEYRILIESSHEVIFSKDKDGRYHTANLKAVIGLGGERVKDIIGKTDYELMPKEQADALRKLDRQVMEEQKPIEIEELVPLSESEIRTYLSHKLPTFDKEGHVSGVACFAMDITEIKKAEHELEKYHENLEELVKARTKELHDTQDELVRKERLATLGQLTATVSHELRNPLGAMRPSLYVIEKKSDKEDEQVQNAIERIDRNIERCDRIIDELLDFTRITELNRKPVHIDEWLKSVINEQTLPKDISLKKELLLNDVELSIDSERLCRAVINVFDNACHAMMDDNKKVVNIKNAQLNIKSEINDERVEIIITDNGSGMSEYVLAKVYEPLFSTKGFGVGLGMPTVKQIMQQHSGGIEIKTEKGKGTSIILWLPTNLQNVKVG